MIPQNAPVLVDSVSWYRLRCWHSKKHLKVQMASNGAAVYCGKCYAKRFGFMVKEDR